MSKKFVLLLFFFSFAVLGQDIESSGSQSLYWSQFPRIKVASPNGGEAWCVDSTYNITWKSIGWIKYVKIEYSTDNDSTWESLTKRTRNGGSYSWKIPDTPSDYCLVRVSALYGWASDVSDGVFSIVSDSSSPDSSYIDIVTPNGGETYYADTVNYIEWDSYNISGMVKIEYTTNAYYDSTGGDSVPNWVTITDSVVDNGSFAWMTPPDISSHYCMVRIADVDGNPTDVSDGVFSIVPRDTVPEPYMRITSPSGGGTWYADTVNYIIWSSSGTSGAVKIEYSPNIYDSIGDSINWITIADSASDTGNFAWLTPPDISSDYCMVRIADVDGSPEDASDIFSIVPHDTVFVPYITVTSPNGGETWYADTANYIEWDSYNTSGILKIEYTTNAYYDSAGGDSVTNWVTISDSAADNGSFEWFTHAGISSENCMVRIIDVDGSPSDVSDDVFSIIPADSTPEQPYITVTSPNGGETWYADTVNYVEWNSYGTSGTVKIEYTLDAYYDSTGGDSVPNWVTITDSAADDGSFDWFTPAGISSENCMVRIADLDGSLSDLSDGVFSIVSIDSISVSSIGNIGLPKSYAINVKGVIPSSKLTINYALPRNASLKLFVYDISGKKIKDVSEEKPAGFYSKEFDMKGSPKGVYFVRIQANGNEFIATRKTVIMYR